MPFLDHVKEGLTKIIPAGSKIPPVGGVSSGHVMHDDDMIVSKPVIILHGCQIFFNFLAMCCFASVAAFQDRFNVGPSGLSGFTLFVTIAGMLLSLFMLLVPVLYEKYDKFTNLARALKEVRVGFILTGVGTSFSLLIAFVVTISAFTQPGCKNAEDDPSAEEAGEEFVDGLPGWCSTKKAAAAFLWFAFVAWAGSLTLLILDWRKGKLHGPRDPPFRPPSMNQDDDDLENSYTHVPSPTRDSEPKFPSAGQPTSYSDPHNPSSYDNSNVPTSPFADANRYSGSPIAASRPSMDAYGAFSDPAPTGFGRQPVPSLPEPDLGPQMSRTMQYANDPYTNDPYAAVRASIHAGQPPQSPGGGAGGGYGGHTPPGYEYQGYR